MNPIARTDRLIKQVVDQDTLVYDSTDDSACCLNALASAVWRRCDGEHSVEQIAELVAKEIELPENVDPKAVVWRVLDELEEHHLVLSLGVSEFDDSPDADRRKVLRMLAVLPLFPAIQRITAPIHTSAASPPPAPSLSGSPGVTPSVSSSPTGTPGVSSTPALTPSASGTPGVTPSASSTPAVTPSASSTPGVTPSASPTPTVTPSASHTPAVTPTASVTPTVTPTPSFTPSATPTPTPTI